MTAKLSLRQEEAKEALHERLSAVASIISAGAQLERATSSLLDDLARIVRRSNSDRLHWLLFLAITGVFPDSRQLGHFRRALSLASDGTAIVAVLRSTIGPASSPNRTMRRLQVVQDRVLVDVTFCATHEHNTGIQRVVRQTLPEWVSKTREFILVASTPDTTGFRSLTPVEVDRVLNWNSRRFEPDSEVREKSPGDPETVVVPWNCQIFLPEVPSMAECSFLACMAESSGNSVSMLGYDAIPLVSATGQRDEESERFAHYLTVVKHADRVVAISESAAEEFRGFCDMLVAQGLEGPSVSSVSLAVGVPAAAKSFRADPGDRPLVLCVGSHEPRKNQEAVIFAAEELFRAGLDFELVFVGGGNATALHDFDKRVRRLNARGAHVSSYRRLQDGQLWRLYARARFTVFVSLHEGFGLPVAESLALATPALTSNFGSLAEIARGGGCVMVDPRDDRAIVGAFRALLTDDELLGRLRAEAVGRESKSWYDYADELWSEAIGSGRTRS